MKPMLLVPNHYVVCEPESLAMETAEVDLAQAIERRFGKVSIAAFGTPLKNDSLQGKLRRNGTEFYRLNLFSSNDGIVRKLINYSCAVALFPFALAKHQWAYVFFPCPSAIIAAWWAVILRRPYGLYVRGTWMAEDGSTSWLWRQVLAHAAFIIATGEAFRKKINRYNQNVHNEVPLTKLRVADLDAEVKRRAAGIRRILYVGRLSEVKGVLDLIKAFSIARNQLKLDIVLDLVGGASPEEEANVRQLAAALGIEKHITLFGHVADSEHLKQRYLMADIFAFASFFAEGFPRVLYEATMHGLPIITTKMPGIEGFLEDGQNCLYCRAKDPRDIARCIERLVNDPVLAVKLGLAGHKKVQELFMDFEHRSHADQAIALAEGLFKSDRLTAIETTRIVR
jgi:glycosyltransferase involved in cell wall biosynthesis